MSNVAHVEAKATISQGLKKVRSSKRFNYSPFQSGIELSRASSKITEIRSRIKGGLVLLLTDFHKVPPEELEGVLIERFTALIPKLNDCSLDDPIQECLELRDSIDDLEFSSDIEIFCETIQEQWKAELIEILNMRINRLENKLNSEYSLTISIEKLEDCPEDRRRAAMESLAKKAARFIRTLLDKEDSTHNQSLHDVF